MNKYIFPIIKWKIKPWLKYYILNKSATSYPLSEIITSASPLTLSNSVRKKFNILNVGGNTVQNGEPTPETPIPVENVSGEVEVKVENKNLAYISSKIDWRYSSTLENGDLKINGTSSGAGNILIKINGGNGLILKPNKTYILSVIMEGTVSGGQYKNIYLKDSSIGALASNKTIKHTITPTENYKLDSINLDLAPNITFTNFTIKIQVEEGSTATSYEPHEEQTATLHLPEGMEMCKIGDYKDGFVEQGGKWYKNKVITKSTIKFNGYSYKADETHMYAWFNKPNNSIDNNTYNTNLIGNVGNLSGAGNKGYYALIFNPNDYTYEEIVEKCKDTPYWYVLKEPVLEEITDPTLISDLESLKNLYSYKGTTYISSSNDPSPIFEVQYYMEEGA